MICRDVLFPLHVEEDLETRIEALIGNLLPELVKFVSADVLDLQPTPSAQCVEEFQCEFLRILHSFGKIEVEEN